MPKALYCARCGIQLAMTRKVYKMQIIDVVEPHECGPIQEIPVVDNSDIEKILKTKDEPLKAAKSARVMLDTFPFVQKLNAAKSEVERPQMQDLRPGRDEVVSSIAPLGVRDMVLERSGASPTHKGRELPDGDDSSGLGGAGEE